LSFLMAVFAFWLSVRMLFYKSLQWKVQILPLLRDEELYTYLQNLNTIMN
jgi:hypothetical protein